MKATKKNIRWGSLFVFFAIAICCHWVSHSYYFRIDLTQDRRHSLSTKTISFLQNLKEDYEAEIFLNGDLPYGFYQLQQATIELIDELNRHASHNISYKISEIDTKNQKTVEQLSKRGVSYTSVNIKDKKGRLTQQLLFPSLILHNKEKEIVVPLLQNNPAFSGRENLTQSISGLEYEITNGLRILTQKSLPKIAFLKSHGTLPPAQTIDFAKSLAENYEVVQINTNKIDSTIRALIIAQPRENFSEEDKFIIDQYIMQGGKILWLIDEVQVSKDSLRNNQATMAYYKPLNVEDMLFTYGIRINPEIVLDMNADLVKVNTALKGEPPRFSPLAWAYEPLLETNPFHPITKGLSPVRAIFANSIDTIPSSTVVATTLLRTSAATRLEAVPKMIRMEEIQHMQQTSFYPKSNTPVAVLLEGKFSSIFRGRLAYTQSSNFRAQSIFTKMVIVADGDIIKNETRGTGDAMQFLPLGYNSDYRYLHGNKIFLLNTIDYLCDEEGWLELRNKEYTPALLNKSKARKERSFWQWINIILPLFSILFLGFLYYFYRKKKYARRLK